MFQRKITMTRRASLLAVSSLLVMGLSGVTSAQEKGVEKSDAQEIEQLEEIVVVGTRASLKKALDVKRNSIGVVDAIISEDIGKFPDLNVSESLQRITGVTINRSVTGEGNTVSLRGLPPEYTRVTLNGMTATSGNEGREFDFNVFASELFSGIRISKTPTADLTEGGLAGTIDLRTPRPLDFDEDKMLVSVGGQYASLGRGDVTPRLSGLYSWRSEGEKFGFLASASYSKSTIRNDTKQGFRWEPISKAGLDELVNAQVTAGGTIPTVNVNGVDINDPDELLALSNNIAFPVLPRVGLDIKERERLGLTAGFQYQPNDGIDLMLNVLYAEFDETGERHTIDGAPGFSGTASIPLSLTTITNSAIDYAVQGTFDGVSQRAESVDEEFSSNILHITFDGKYDLSDELVVSTEFGYSEAHEDELRRTYLYNHVGQFSYDLTDPKWPKFSGADFDYLNADDYNPNQLRFRPRSRDDRAYKLRADLSWEQENSALTSLKGGVEYRDRKKVNSRLTEIRPTPPLPFSDLATNLPVDDFMSGAPAGVVTDFLVTDLVKGRELLLPDSIFSMTSPDLRASWAVSEKITSGYVQSNWDFDLDGSHLTVNLGVRVAHTNQTSDGHQKVGSNFEPVSVKNKYTDVLPSLTVRWDMSDDFVVRMAANKAITRPTLSQLSSGLTVNSTNTLTASSGNPNLKPFRANQFDISLEWYFAPESLISITAFYKDMQSFIVSSEIQQVIEGSNLINDNSEDVSGQTFTVKLPVNGTGGELYGVELSYQQPFIFLPAPFDGFGVLANVTLTESKGTVFQGGVELEQPLQGQSDISYNLIAYYEKDKFGMRAAYSYRGKYIRAFRNAIWPSGTPHTQFVNNRGQLDLSARYQLNDMIQFYVDAINITSTDHYFYDTLPGMSGDYFEQGPVYNFGVRATF
ncbi:MAG: hypothetical protein COB36_11810 [Alphaproteobacteria bacterium]|nr:MAG: hypothetical protein COB36_11810 [Alphaproteobacteria bacterium]